MCEGRDDAIVTPHVAALILQFIGEREPVGYAPYGCRDIVHTFTMSAGGNIAMR